MTRACFGCVMIAAALGTGCSLTVLDEALLERRFACDTDTDCPTDQRCSARSIFVDGPRDEARLCVSPASIQEECRGRTVPEDPRDPLNYNCANDADADGVIEPLDCDDDDASLGSRATDADCDGVLTASDCDDDDASSTTRATDADCDGVFNDFTCAAGRSVSTGSSTTRTGATTGTSTRSGSCGGGGPEQAWQFTPTTTGRYQITTTGYDTVLYVRSDCGAAADTLGCSDDAPGLGTGSQVTVSLTENVPVLVVVDSYEAGGSYTLRIVRQ